MATNKTAFITGITGQDGSYLAEFLLSKKYRVFGFENRGNLGNYQNISHILNKVKLIPGDMRDEKSMVKALKFSRPTEVYNLAAQSKVGLSWRNPIYTAEVTGIGPVKMLEAIRKIDPKIKFYQASSSEMFGAIKTSPQNEQSSFYPHAPYGVARLYAHWMTINYRDGYGLFAVSGILFNHESPRRGLEFVTRKITSTASKIKLGLAKKLILGDLEARRDWGFAGDYVEAMWLMLQQPKPKDYVIGTGEAHSVKEFVKEAFDYLRLDWEKYVKIDEKFVRPKEVYNLVADSSIARRELGWKPKVAFKELVRMMVDMDIKHLSNKNGPVIKNN